MRWERLCVHKEFGGMVFKDLYGFNLAMLGKQGWKLLTDNMSLVSKILKAPRGFLIGQSRLKPKSHVA
ncbi:hypothetical protein LINGRAHAP2_LOCUS23786 [Linum grandiflorum]